MLALGLDNGRLVVVDEATGEEKWAVQAHSQQSLVHVAVPPNGRFVASVGFDDYDWKIWDAWSGKLHRVVATHDGVDFPQTHSSFIGNGLRAVAFSPCGQRLATRDSDGAVVLWDVRTGVEEQRMQGEDGDAWGIAFTADGARVASGTGDMGVDVFDAMTGTLLRLIVERDILTCVSFSPTAISMLATAATGGPIHVWDIDSGDMIREIEGCSVAMYSPDGRTIASSAGEYDVQLMDAESGEMGFRMVGHTDAVLTASWCPYDGTKLASGGDDGTCKVWDSLTGELLRSIDIGGSVSGGSIESVVWGRDWVRDAMAFAMGHHPRLGAESQVLELEEGVVRMILDRV
jgi:WD40 repeat protein